MNNEPQQNRSNRVDQYQQRQSASRTAFLFIILLLLLDEPPPPQQRPRTSQLRGTNNRSPPIVNNHEKGSSLQGDESDRFRLLDGIFSKYQKLEQHEKDITNPTNVTGLYSGQWTVQSEDYMQQIVDKNKDHVQTVDATILPPGFSIPIGIADGLLDRIIAITYLRQNDSNEISKEPSKSKSKSKQQHESESNNISKKTVNYPSFDAELSIETISKSRYPDIKDVTLVNGLLKLTNFCQYNSKNCLDWRGSSRHNIIIGVRGLYFQKIGRMSLIANTAFHRGVLYVGPRLIDSKAGDDKRDVVESQNTTVADNIISRFQHSESEKIENHDGMIFSLPPNPVLPFRSMQSGARMSHQLATFFCEFSLDLQASYMPINANNETSHLPTSPSGILTPDKLLDLSGTALSGSIISRNCNIAANATFKGVSEQTQDILREYDNRGEKAMTNKALNYSFIMMLVSIAQIVFLLRQLIHTQSQSTMRKVSLACIGWQTAIDAYLCLIHVVISLLVEHVFTAMASVAFFKLLIFCVIEMKYMAMIMYARERNGNGTPTREALRRHEGKLHVRFYIVFFITFFFFSIFFGSNQQYLNRNSATAVLLFVYSFWVPQIMLNAYTEAKKPLHSNYIYVMSTSRLIVPLYFLAVPNNFLTNMPSTQTILGTSFSHADKLFMCEALFLWVGLQTGILIAQSRYGARFFVPKRFLPTPFDYSRTIPNSVLANGRKASNTDNETTSDDASNIESDLDVPAGSPSDETISLNVTRRQAVSGAPHRGKIENRHRRRIASLQSTLSSLTGSLGQGSVANQDSVSVYLDCVICCSDITPREINTKRYMLAPCNHIFHQSCLTSWMDVKMECPVCRTELPAI